jgi:two-component SAPR family response regulator
VVERQRRFHLALGDAADVDLWRVHEHLFRAARALDAPTKIMELKAACAEYKGPLADGAAFAWIAPHRERVDRLIAEAKDKLAALSG